MDASRTLHDSPSAVHACARHVQVEATTWRSLRESKDRAKDHAEISLLRNCVQDGGMTETHDVARAHDCVAIRTMWLRMTLRSTARVPAAVDLGWRPAHSFLRNAKFCSSSISLGAADGMPPHLTTAADSSV
jgi:hypothetical protein